MCVQRLRACVNASLFLLSIDGWKKSEEGKEKKNFFVRVFSPFSVSPFISFKESFILAPSEQRGALERETFFCLTLLPKRFFSFESVSIPEKNKSAKEGAELQSAENANREEMLSSQEKNSI